MDAVEFMGPNGHAREETRIRTGPPLDYIGEKLQNALCNSHSAYRSIKERTPAHMNQDALGQLGDAIYCQLVAYLALYNLLAVANQEGLVARLLSVDAWGFKEWLQRIQVHGSLYG